MSSIDRGLLMDEFFTNFQKLFSNFGKEIPNEVKKLVDEYKSKLAVSSSSCSSRDNPFNTLNQVGTARKSKQLTNTLDSIIEEKLLKSSEKISNNIKLRKISNGKDNESTEGTNITNNTYITYNTNNAINMSTGCQSMSIFGKSSQNNQNQIPKSNENIMSSSNLNKNDSQFNCQFNSQFNSNNIKIANLMDERKADKFKFHIDLQNIDSFPINFKDSESAVIEGAITQPKHEHITEQLINSSESTNQNQLILDLELRTNKIFSKNSESIDSSETSKENKSEMTQNNLSNKEDYIITTIVSLLL